MPDVSIRLHPFANMERAVKVAEDIRNSGTVKYIDAEGSEVTVNVGDVTVEGG